MRLPYGESNFKYIIEENRYYIDKTRYIEEFENSDSNYVFFLRPRRFGKSLFVSMLEYYYGVQYKNDFRKLFGNLYIGKNTTKLANAYMILKFEFSRINTKTQESTEEGFLKNVKSSIRNFFSAYNELFNNEQKNRILDETNPADCLKMLFNVYNEVGELPPICILIDEYDHFANELLAFDEKGFETSVTQNGFVRKFYETIKTATADNIVHRFFATGVTPITLDSMTSGFNIARNLSTRKSLNAAMGFTKQEVVNLLKDVSKSVALKSSDIDKIMLDLTKWYNGYLFHEDAIERIYNSDMILYFVSEFSNNLFKKYPKSIIDTNIASDYGKIRKLFDLRNKKGNYEVLEEIIKKGKINSRLTNQFSFEKEFEKKDFISLLYYMGFLSITGERLGTYEFSIPNFVINSLFYDYFLKLVKDQSELPQAIDIHEKLLDLADNNNIKPLISLIESTLKGLSNRDYIHFDEKYIKLLFVTYGNAAGFYYVKSEPEIHQLYPDVMFLYRPPYFPKYQFIFELKYLKKSDSDDKVQAKLQEAESQLKSYLNNKELQNFIYRPEGGKETLKSYSIVFRGTKAEIIKEYSI